MTNSAIGRTTGCLVAALFIAVGAAVSIAPANADPVYDAKFLDYLDAKGVPFKNRTDIIRTAKRFCLDMGRQGGSVWKVGYRLMKDQGWTESQAETFIQGAVPTYCPQAWG
ncbi:DUF732 domain-containing protein [Mycobacterium sp. NPDC048908]|uniref:DUF732 domain-containing protein n=1 Tax=Mycobacterium sp. NPDC048908 TaxID=3364292 RepID=UPI003723ADB2